MRQFNHSSTVSKTDDNEMLILAECEVETNSGEHYFVLSAHLGKDPEIFSVSKGSLYREKSWQKPIESYRSLDEAVHSEFIDVFREQKSYIDAKLLEAMESTRLS